MRVIRTHALIGAVCLLVGSIGWAELPPDTEVVTGESQGALHAIYLPASWNSDLAILYQIPGFREVVPQLKMLFQGILEVHANA
jgi:hypothetical protein